MPITMAEFETLAAAKPAGTPLAEILSVGNIYWSGSLTGYIYLIPEVMGKPGAIVPASLKGRFGG
ncbi:MAG: hypothetical protein HY727_09890 [Candidatus Rokubacteria bacterium]|nr:hypothetical protein [Candidatus Rokubacteria bacterium]